MRPHYQVHRVGLLKRRWTFRFRAANGEITSVASETYRDQTDARRAAADDRDAHYHGTEPPAINVV